MHGILRQEEITEQELEYEKDRLLRFMFPNEPISEEENAMLTKAALYQAAHDRERAELSGRIPPGARSYEIGHFRVEMGKDWEQLGDHLTRKTICSAAYSVLLRAGLLYKGVERTE